MLQASQHVILVATECGPHGEAISSHPMAPKDIRPSILDKSERKQETKQASRPLESLAIMDRDLSKCDFSITAKTPPKVCN